MKNSVSSRTRRDRIRVAIAAFAYERHLKPIMTDQAYDQLSQRVHQHRNVATGYHRLDRFFQRNFDPDTGLWIHKHPGLDEIEQIYNRVWGNRKNR